MYETILIVFSELYHDVIYPELHDYLLCIFRADIIQQNWKTIFVYSMFFFSFLPEFSLLCLTPYFSGGSLHFLWGLCGVRYTAVFLLPWCGSWSVSQLTPLTCLLIVPGQTSYSIKSNQIYKDSLRNSIIIFYNKLYTFMLINSK